MFFYTVVGVFAFRRQKRWPSVYIRKEVFDSKWWGSRNLYISSWILLLSEIGVICVAEVMDLLYNIKRN